MSLHRRLSLNGPSPSSISVDPLYAFPRLSEPSYPAPSTPSAVAERGEGEVETTSSSEELTLAEETEMLRRGNEARERRFSAREARLASDDSFGSASLSSRLSLSRHPSLASPLPLHRRRDIRRPDPAPRPHYHALAAVHSHQSYQASLSPTAALTDSQHRAEALSLLESLPSPILDALASELRQFALEQQDRNRRKRLERERAVDRVRALRDEEQDSSGTLGTANTEEAGVGGMGRRASFPSYAAVPPSTTRPSPGPSRLSSPPRNTSSPPLSRAQREGGRRTPPPPYSPYDPFSSAPPSSPLMRAATTSMTGVRRGIRARERTDRRPTLVRREQGEWV